MTNSDARFNRDTFFVNQKHLSLGKSKYQVFDEQGQVLFRAERPVMRLFGARGHITIYAEDGSGSGEPVLTLLQDHSYEFFNRDYTLVEGRGGQRIARLCRNNFRSLFRRSWQVYDPSGKMIALARENSTLMTIVRRVVDFIPYLNILGLIIKTDFELYRVEGEQDLTLAGRFDRKVGIGDKYVLRLDQDPGRRLDRRIALGLGVLLDTAEAR